MNSKILNTHSSFQQQRESEMTAEGQLGKVFGSTRARKKFEFSSVDKRTWVWMIQHNESCPKKKATNKIKGEREREGKKWESNQRKIIRNTSFFSQTNNKVLKEISFFCTVYISVFCLWYWLSGVSCQLVVGEFFSLSLFFTFNKKYHRSKA